MIAPPECQLPERSRRRRSDAEKAMRRRWWVGALPACLVASRASALAADEAASSARRCVAKSLVSDKLSLVEKLGGSSDPTQNRPHTSELPLAGCPHDLVALKAIAASSAAVDPSARISFLAGTEPEFYADHQAWFEGDSVIRPQRLRKAIAAETADRLMLLTKWRGDAVISDDKTSVGSGKLSGLGLYRYARREGLSQGQTDVHVLSAPFVYARLSLIDLATSKVIRSKIVQDARPYPATATTEQQIAGMLELLTASTEAAVATVLGG